MALHMPPADPPLRRLWAVWNTCANVLILPANDTTPDGMLIPDGPSGIVEVDRLMERLQSQGELRVLAV